MTLGEKILRLAGPILVLGASGFVGANLLALLLRYRKDVHGTATRTPWRLANVPASNVAIVDLLTDSDLSGILRDSNPKTIFDCVAYGGYSFETDDVLMYKTNFELVYRLLKYLETRRIEAYIHAGSSSEYGDNSSGPTEASFLAPNSPYAVAKSAAAHLIYFYGKKRELPCANLRLYSIYGPWEDSSRLIPTLVRYGWEHRYPPLANPEISRDFVYVDDACEAFIDAALQLRPAQYGESFNIASGQKTTIAEVAAVAAGLFGISGAPEFSYAPRHWDRGDWYGNPEKALQHLGWQSRIGFSEGLRRTSDWYAALTDRESYEKATKNLQGA